MCSKEMQKKNIFFLFEGNVLYGFFSHVSLVINMLKTQYQPVKMFKSNVFNKSIALTAWELHPFLYRHFQRLKR